MYKLKFLLIAIMVIAVTGVADAKKYKYEHGKHSLEVYTTGQGANRTQLVKAWAVAGNADKAILQAKMDAVDAAFFTGLPYDESTHGMGVSNLGPILSEEDYATYKTLIDQFFKKGDFLLYVKDVNSAYPSGENNIKVSGGRRVGVNLILDYNGLQKWTVDNNIKKGLGNHFRN